MQTKDEKGMPFPEPGTCIGGSEMTQTTLGSPSVQKPREDTLAEQESFKGEIALLSDGGSCEDRRLAAMQNELADMRVNLGDAVLAIAEMAGSLEVTLKSILRNISKGTILWTDDPKDISLDPKEVSLGNNSKDKYLSVNPPTSFPLGKGVKGENPFLCSVQKVDTLSRGYEHSSMVANSCEQATLSQLAAKLKEAEALYTQLAANKKDNCAAMPLFDEMICGSDMDAVGKHSCAAPSVKKAKPKITAFDPKIREFVNDLFVVWPKQRDGKRIPNDVVTAAARVETIIKTHPEVTLDLLREAASSYLDTAPQFPNAIQFWFGPGKPGQMPPWEIEVRAALTKKENPKC